MIEGVKLNLGGTEYVVPPLNLKAMRRLLPAIQAMQPSAIPSDEDLKTVVDVVHSALVRNYPTVTPEQVEEWLDVSNMRAALDVVLNRSGLEKGKLEGNVGAATGSTGDGSTGTSLPQPDGPTTM